jgi:uncharacterized protein with GYD domain
MPSFIMLGSFTDQGIRHVKDTVKRADAFKASAKEIGVDVKAIYWTLGQYDVVAVAEASDDDAMTALGLTLGKAGNVRTQTLRAFSQSEMTAILEKTK